MKNIYIYLILLLGINCFSQVSIGKNQLTNSSVSLEFGSENRGLLLPWVTSSSEVVNAVDGTMIYDVADKKVKLMKSGSWFDLSVDTTGEVDTTSQDNLIENKDAKIAIGVNADSDTTAGILVLTDTDKAMILPKVESPHLNIVSPSPGMIVYDTKSKQLAIFNGTVWSFWKP